MSTASTLETMMRNELAKLEQEHRDKAAPFIAVLAYLESMKPRAMALTPDMVAEISKGMSKTCPSYGKLASAAGGVSPAVEPEERGEGFQGPNFL